MLLHHINNMLKGTIFYIVVTVFCLKSMAQDSVKTAKDTLLLSGQLSAWGLYNGENNLPVYLGIRYIPTLNYSFNLKNDRKIDFETSLNAYENMGFRPFNAN